MADKAPLLACIFAFSPEELKSNQEAINDEYSRLLKVCRDAGLAVVGKRSRTPGTIVIFVDCHDDGRRNAIVSWENAITFPTNSRELLNSVADELTRAAVVRALVTYITVPENRGGLGVSPGSHEYPHLKLVLSPHPLQVKKEWIKKLTGGLGFGYSNGDIAHIAAFYGEAAAVYFAFLTHYTRALVLPAVVGIGLHFGAPAFFQHSLFGIFLVIWAIVFTEQWRQKHRSLLATLFGESYSPSCMVSRPGRHSAWWSVEAKTVLTIPLLFGSTSFVCFNMTVAFLLEAFITRLYDGPLRFVAPLVPIVYNAMTTPPFVSVYGIVSDKMTSWEGHPTQRAHDFSLLVKLLPVNGAVAFYALVLSAGVYIPYGNELMKFFHLTLFEQPSSEHDTGHGGSAGSPLPINSWRRSVHEPPPTTPKTRLAEQMFSFTLVLQLFPIALEVLLPFVIRFFNTRLGKSSRPGASRSAHTGSEATSGGKEDELVGRAVFESSLPSHRFFEDYLTLIIQFGYGVMWSTTWPLAPAVLLLLATIRLRADALKMLVHYRYSIPSRDACDSAGIWTGALSFVTWASVLVNTLLGFVVHPLMEDPSSVRGNVADGPRLHKFDVPAFVQNIRSSASSSLATFTAIRSQFQSTAMRVEKRDPISSFAPLNITITTAILLASHAYFVALWYIRHLFASAGRDQVSRAQTQAVLPQTPHAASSPAAVIPSAAFWDDDEGESEISKKII